jgi:triosephosphate isomerase
MRLPLILINFKAYEQSIGEKGLKLAKTCEKISKRYRVNIAVSPQHFDLKAISSKVKIPVFAQDIDAVDKPGSRTGHLVAGNLRKIGVKGTLINHSEKQLDFRGIKRRIGITKKTGLVSVCCVPTITVGKKVAKLKPDFIAFEVPELIGTGRPISKERPDSVKKFVKEIRRVSRKPVPLCGAGISNGEDVRAAIDLGTKGVLVASAVVKARKPEKVLKEFALAAKK